MAPTSAHPGPRNRSTGRSSWPAFWSGSPAERVGTTTNVTGAVIYLASPAASLVTGTVLAVDGGWTAH